MVEFHAVELVGVQDGTSNTLLVGEFGRGPDSIGIGNWFVSWDASVQRVSIAGIDRSYTAPLPFAYTMNRQLSLPSKAHKTIWASALIIPAVPTSPLRMAR